jgi:phospholipid/cholesterol/gamma-HCH transport system substrate-binding protein
LFDYTWGFRAYGAPGVPPDTAGPRALFPWPFNQIPGGSR